MNWYKKIAQYNEYGYWLSPDGKLTPVSEDPDGTHTATAINLGHGQKGQGSEIVHPTAMNAGLVRIILPSKDKRYIYPQLWIEYNLPLTSDQKSQLISIISKTTRGYVEQCKINIFNKIMLYDGYSQMEAISSLR